MKKSTFIKLPDLFVVCTFLFVGLKLSAQTENVQPKFKQVMVYIPKAKIVPHLQKDNFMVIDSLKGVVNNYDSLYQKQLLQSKINDDNINELKQKISSQQAVYVELEQRVFKYETLNLQTRKNNFILIIFNSSVCILLFAMLIRHLINLRKNKSWVMKHVHDISKEISEPDSISEQNKIVHNLYLLERIGRLRDIGALTEEEFVFQKQMILKNLH